MANIEVSSQFRISAPGVAPIYANRFNRAQRLAQNELLIALHNSGVAAVKALQAAAPEGDIPHERGHRTGTLKRAIQILGEKRNARFPQVTVGIYEGIGGALSPRLFPYATVTRRGRKAIKPEVARRGNAHLRPTAKRLTDRGVPTGGTLGRAAALGPFPGKGGHMIYRREVAPYKPPSDWVQEADPAVRAAAQAAMDTAARSIGQHLSRGFSRQTRVRRI